MARDGVGPFPSAPLGARVYAVDGPAAGGVGGAGARRTIGVDFGLTRASRSRVAVLARSGPPKDDLVRSEFRELPARAEGQGVRTGRWIFRQTKDDRWAACLASRGRTLPAGRIRRKTLPSPSMARRVFDPDAIAIERSAPG